MALVERGLAETRAAAQRLVMAGLVFSNDRRLDKAGASVASDTPIEVRGQPHPYVSRGGLKLEKALDHFAIPVAGRVALDVGSSTGGFTDLLLQRGAARVYAVDVGTNQLAWKLRSDDRVVVHEQTNARTLTAAVVPEPVDVIVCDAAASWVTSKGWTVLGVETSPITGPEGNVEFLLAATKRKQDG